MNDIALSAVPRLVAADLLTADDKDDDGIPLLKPVSCGREGQEPLIIKLPTLQAEAEAIADHLVQSHKEGFGLTPIPRTHLGSWRGKSSRTATPRCMWCARSFLCR